jgi:hypothetical protein
MTTAPDELDQLLAALERQASGTLATVVKIREALAALREPVADAERVPVPMPEVTRERALRLLNAVGYVPSGDSPVEGKAKGRKRAAR